MNNEKYVCTESGRKLSRKSFAEPRAREAVRKRFGEDFVIKKLTFHDMPPSGARQCVRVKATPKPRWCRSRVIEVDVFFETDGIHISHLESVIISPILLPARPGAKAKTSAATI